MTYPIAESFVSINGEGTKAGQPAVFIRFTGCNLRCSYCDTRWANEENASHTQMTAEEIYAYIKSTGIKNVTITGGEPLIQNGITELLCILAGDRELYIEIETNGSADLSPFADMKNRPSFTMDYKLPSSGMEKHMLTGNFRFLDTRDTVKFVSGSITDLERAKEVIYEFSLDHRTNVYISPVFGKIKPSEIVEFMLKNKMNGVNMQLQIHKFIWPPDMRGV